MLKDLIKIANRLDSLGLTKEADYLDLLITKLAQEEISGSQSEIENYNSSGNFPPVDQMIELFFKSYKTPDKTSALDFINKINIKYNSLEQTEKDQLKRNLEQNYKGYTDYIDSETDPEKKLNDRLRVNIYNEILNDERLKESEKSISKEQIGALLLEHVNDNSDYKMSGNLFSQIAESKEVKLADLTAEERKILNIN